MLTTEFSTIPSCRHFSTCSGCQTRDELPAIWSEIQQYSEAHGVVAEFFSAEKKEWRTRVKLAVRGSPSDPQIGLFAVGTHQVIEILDCPMHHPKINAALIHLKNAMISLKIPPFDEKTLTGLLRYVQLVIERSTGLIQLTLVVNDLQLPPSIATLVQELLKSHPWHSIWVNLQPGSTNTIFGKEWILCHGETYLWEKLNGIDICFHPACFGQAHLSLFERVLSSLQKAALPHKKVIEFYAGIGTIGLNLSAKSQQLICTEINPFSQPCFDNAVKKLPPEIQQKVSFHQGAAANSLSLLEGMEVAIVDPPRKGIDRSLLHSLPTQETLEQIIYLSCFFPTFKRDAEYLFQHGWKLDHLEGYLFFPGTDHVETLAFFKKEM